MFPLLQTSATCPKTSNVLQGGEAWSASLGLGGFQLVRPLDSPPLLARQDLGCGLFLLGKPMAMAGCRRKVSYDIIAAQQVH